MSSWEDKPMINSTQPSQKTLLSINDISTVPSISTSKRQKHIIKKIFWINFGIFLAVLAVASFIIPFGASVAINGLGTTISTSTVTAITIRTYGGLSNNGNDDGDTGSVVVDYDNVIAPYGGASVSRYVQYVSFNFSVAPSGSTPTIWLYAMNLTTPPDTFTPTVIYQVPYELIITGSIGAQTMVLPANALPVSQNQYIAVGFDTTGGGSCYQVTNRNQYYLGPPSFSALTTATYTYIGAGIAFSFSVVDVVPVYG